VRLARQQSGRVGERSEQMAGLGSPSATKKKTSYNYAQLVFFICEANSGRETPRFSQQSPAAFAAGLSRGTNHAGTLE